MMKKNKKWMFLGMAVSLILSLTACGGSSEKAGTETGTASTELTAEGNEGQAVGEQPFVCSDYGISVNCFDFLTGDYPQLPADGPVYNFSLAHANSETSDQSLLMQDLKAALEYYSEGKILLTLYPNGQMGSDSEMISSCIAGDIDIVYQSGSTHATFVPETVIFDTPFLFTGYDTEKVEQILTDSEFRNLYDLANEEAGLVCLMLKASDTMNLTTNRKITDLSSLKGLKVRTAQAESRMAIWEALGANPTPLAWNELYMALQNGTVEAQDNMLSNAVTAALVEQQKYLFPSKHMVAGFDVTMNKDTFYEMPQEYQKFLTQICDELSGLDYAMSREKEEGYYNDILNKYGLELCPISDELFGELKVSAQPAVEKVKKMVENDAMYEVLEKLLTK